MKKISFFNWFKIECKVRKIMGLLEDVLARQQNSIDAIKAVDEVVEGLFDLIKQLTGDGITPDAAAKLLAKEDELDAAVAKIPTDDEPTT